LATAPLLDLQRAEACARAAVFAALDVARLQADLGGTCLVVESAARTRDVYLRRPDLGRTLGPGAPSLPRLAIDLALVIADGLSATAANRHAAPLVHALKARLADWRLGPIVLAQQGRVALGDPIGEALGARAVLVLIGERPGLSAADSLSAYLTWAPRTGRLDSERNCVSNIRPEGLGTEAAADKIAWLLTEARRLGFTGVDLKDRADAGPPALSAP
jgi:ethanolamine ammonia-lyase small subunit